MIEALIKKLEESGSMIILDVRIKVPEKPIQPDQKVLSLNTEGINTNAEANYQKRLGAWKELLKEIELLHIGGIELKQYRKGGD
jgi:hypothetical protein